MRTLLIAESRVFRTGLSQALESNAWVELVASEFSLERGLQRLNRGDIELVLLDLSRTAESRNGFLKQLEDLDGSGPMVLAIAAQESDVALTRLGSTSRGLVGIVPKSAADIESTVAAIEATLSRIGQQPDPKLLPKPAARVTADPGEPSAPRKAASLADASGLGELVVIVSSTGGPVALQALLGGLAPSFDTPIVIVQHLPPGFDKSLAANLARQTGRSVRVAQENEPLTSSQILLAPGENHLEVQRSGGALVCRVVRGPRENGCRPAGDRALRTAALASRGRMVGVCLTGMGRDGADGMVEVARAGGQVIVQDEASSVVWGMPSSVLASGVRASVLPLQSISATLNRKASRAA